MTLGQFSQDSSDSFHSVDGVPPVIEDLPDIIITIELGTATAAQATWSAPQVTDNSGVVILDSQTHFPGAFFPLGTTPVTYTYRDGEGNTASTTFNVIVQTGEWG